MFIRLITSLIGINRAWLVRLRPRFLVSVHKVSTATTDTSPRSPRNGSDTRSRPDESAAGRSRPARDPFFDNAKFLLIVLVVIGHNWYPLISHARSIKAAYMVVYSFHMPAFILLSGYFSRGFEARPDQVRKLVKTVLVPYFIFQTAYLWVTSVTDRTPFRFDLTAPSYVCWFLLALFVWRLTTPVWRALPQPLLISVVVSVCAGLMNATVDFAIGRILQFLPFFVLGLTLGPEHFTRLRRTPVRLWAGAVVLFALPVAYLMAPGTDVDWLDLEFGVDHFAGVGVVRYTLVRLALLAVSLVMTAAVLSLVPSRRLWFTALGALTMYPYLLHGMIVKFAEAVGVHDAVIHHGPYGAVLLTLGAITLALLLSTPPVRRGTRWAVEPRLPRARTPRPAPH